MANSNFVVHNGLTVGPLSVDAATGQMIARDILPTDTLTYNLGSPTKQWHSVYVGPGSLYVNGQKVLQDNSGTIVLSADLDQNLSVQTSGSGDIIFDPTGTGVISLRGPVQMQAGSNFVSSDGNAISFTNSIAVNAVGGAANNTDLTLSAQGTGHVKVDDSLIVTGDLTIQGTTANLSVTNLSVQDNIIDIASETTGVPTANAGIRVVRGDEAAVQFRWNETANKWQFTNDGTTYLDIMAATSTGDLTVTGILAGPAVFTIDPAAVGDNTGTVVIKGNLQVDGTTVTVNSATLDVTDKNITVAKGAVNAAAANGAGLTVDGASATMLYTSATDTFNFNKGVVADVTGNLTGNVTGNASGSALTVTQAAQPAITSVGTLTGLTVSGAITTTTGSTTKTTYKDASANNIVEEYAIYLNATATTADQVVDTLAIASYSGVKYIIEATTATNTEIVESTVVYDSANNLYQNDATIIASSAALLATYSSEIVSGSLRFLVTPANANTKLKVKAIAFRKI